MGPLKLADYVGLDTCKFIMDGWQEAYPEQPLFRTPGTHWFSALLFLTSSSQRFWTNWWPPVT